MSSTETPKQKTTSELVVEISLLEREIQRSERHLLSLYRSAIENYFASSPFIINFSMFPSSYDSSSTVQDPINRSQYQATTPIEADHANEELDRPYLNDSAEEISFTNYSQMRCSPAHEPASSSKSIPSHSLVVDQRMKMGKSLSGHHTLADYLSTNIQDHIAETACKISEDIIKCISSVYCKLTSSTNKQIELLPSSSSSCTTSLSILSPENPSHSLSPQFWCETASSPCHIKLPKQKHDPYKDMIAVPMICLDDDRFKFAFKKLKIFRSLIGRLEDVDPRKMEQNGQLAFWINIHNALMMHAFLAYGLHKNQMRYTSSILRAAYNIGGHSINIDIIQNLLLGCLHPHYASSHLRSLFETARKFGKLHGKHPYALHHPEPHAYFALCMGASSDPAVRIYTAKEVHQELNLARREYNHAKVSIRKRQIILPKLLYYYAKAASIKLPSLIEMASRSMEADEQRAIQECFQRNGRKSVKLSPFKTDFRFLFHRDLAK